VDRTKCRRQRRGDEADINNRGSDVRKGAQGPTIFSFFLDSIIIFRSYKLTLSDQAQVALQVRVSLSVINVNIFSQFALAGAEGGSQYFFTGSQTRSRLP